MNVLKEVAGIYFTKTEITITVGRLMEDLSIELYDCRVFENKYSEFDLVERWVNVTVNELKAHFVMESTGSYYYEFANYLIEKRQNVSVIFGNKINTSKSVKNTTQINKANSKKIAIYSLEKKLDLWKPSLLAYKNLKKLTRKRQQILKAQMIENNKLNQKKNKIGTTMRLSQIETRIKYLNNQDFEIKISIMKLLESEIKIKDEVERICTIPGIGELTAITILAETNGFELIRSKKQLVSYAGFDVIEKYSNTSLKYNSKISKKGNKNIRRVLFKPALCAIKGYAHYKEIYNKYVDKSGVKIKGIIAVQRKLLELSYILYKTKKCYDKYFFQKKREQSLEIATL